MSVSLPPIARLDRLVAVVPWIANPAVGFLALPQLPADGGPSHGL
jgi:hypothetical protein